LKQQQQHRITSSNLSCVMCHCIGVTLEQPSFHLLHINKRLPLLLIEYERRLCWTALGDDGAVRNSTSTLSRAMGHEARLCWLAMADAYQAWGRLPLSLQCTEQAMAIAALEQSQPALSLEHPSLLARAGHLARLLGDSFRAEQMSREALGHAAGDALQEARLNLAILHWRQPAAATTSTPVVDTQSLHSGNGATGASALSSPNPASSSFAGLSSGGLVSSMAATRAKLRRYKQLEESVDYVSNILSSFDRNRADVNAAAYFWRGNFYLLQASVLPAISSYMQSLAVAYRYMLQQREVRTKEQARDRDTIDDSKRQQTSGASAARSGSGGKDAWHSDQQRDTSAEICGPHVEARSVFQLEFSMYDLRHFLAGDDDTLTNAPSSIANGGVPTVARAHLLTRATFRGLVCFYTELLLRYGANERVYWYRANAYKCQGDLQAYAHDLDRMYKQNERFLADYLAHPIPSDHRDDTILAWIQWELAQQIGLGVLTSNGCEASHKRLYALMNKFYDALLATPSLPCEDPSYAIACSADVARIEGHIDKATEVSLTYTYVYACYQ
jgi:hypothetical protein